jgi:TRAP-type mannitol/chloroaromatic compound transport system substrate-binding protein
MSNVTDQRIKLLSFSSSLTFLYLSVVSIASLALGCTGEESEGPDVETSTSSLETSGGGLETFKSGPSAKIKIPTRVFSASPSLGAKETSVSDHNSPNYGALSVFFDKVKKHTNHAVAFQIASWSTSSPNSVIQQVGISDDPTDTGVPRDAAYESGGSLNPVWGFVFNSTPFGLEFDLMMRFLYDEGGLALAQSIVDERGLNVKLLPVVGSNPQGSGYFKQPIGKAQCNGERDCLRQAPIGLEGLCQAGWIFRYLPPAQDVLDRACTQLVNEGIIPAKNLSFVASIPGQSMLRSVQLEKITAFEFATPLDDYDSPPEGSGFFPPLTTRPIASESQNPGHKGLRFAHFASWHQPFFIGWLMVNKSSVWDHIPARYRHAIEDAAKEALEESYWYSKSLQRRALDKILDHNDGQVQLDGDGKPILVEGRTVSADMKLAEWPKEALARLKKATDAHLESLKGGATPTIDQKDYTKVITALRSYMRRIGYKWDPKNFDYSPECHH